MKMWRALPDVTISSVIQSISLPSALLCSVKLPQCHGGGWDGVTGLQDGTLGATRLSTSTRKFSIDPSLHVNTPIRSLLCAVAGRDRIDLLRT